MFKEDIVRKTALISAILLASLQVLAPDAGAYTVSYRQTVTTGQGGAPAIQMRVWVKDDKMRVETDTGSGQGIMIFKDKEMYTYVPQQGMWMKMPHGQDAEFQYVEDSEKYVQYLEKQGAVKTGSETVNGYPCDIYEYKDKQSGADVTAWVWKEKEFPVKMVLAGPGIDSQVLFSNIRVNEPISDEMFEVPRSQKTVDMTNIKGMLKAFQD